MTTPKCRRRSERVIPSQSLKRTTTGLTSEQLARAKRAAAHKIQEMRTKPMSDYIPTTIEVETAYNAMSNIAGNMGYRYRGHVGGFDRWLAAHDREVAAKAWQEGAESAFYNPEIRGLVDYPDNNPYRKEKKTMTPAEVFAMRDNLAEWDNDWQTWRCPHCQGQIDGLEQADD